MLCPPLKTWYLTFGVMHPNRSSFTRIFSNVSYLIYMHMRYNISSGCIKVFSSEQDLHIGGAARMDLERMDIAEGVLSRHDDVGSVQTHT